MLLKKLSVKKAFLFLGFIIVLYALVNLYFIFFVPSSCCLSLPTDPCTKKNNINDGVQCCDNYNETQENFTFQEIKDECYWRRVYDNQCSFKSDLYQIKDVDETQEELSYYRSICKKIESKTKKDSCNTIIDKNLACYTRDIKDCKSDDYLCLGVLGNKESSCLSYIKANEIIDCLRAIIRVNEKYDKKICDLWQKQLIYLEQDLMNRSFYETEINWCYMDAGVKGKEIEACYHIKEGDWRREFCFQEARKF